MPEVLGYCPNMTPGGRFAKGKSGNPRGRPRGSRNKSTLAAQALLEGQAETLTQKAVEMALDGNVLALRLCLDRIYPVQKDRLVEFDLPRLENQSDVTEATRRILQAVSEGRLTVQEAEKLDGILERFQGRVLARELEQRISELEQHQDEVKKASGKWYQTG